MPLQCTVRSIGFIWRITQRQFPWELSSRALEIRLQGYFTAGWTCLASRKIVYSIVYKIDIVAYKLHTGRSKIFWREGQTREVLDHVPSLPTPVFPASILRPFPSPFPFRLCPSPSLFPFLIFYFPAKGPQVQLGGMDSTNLPSGIWVDPGHNRYFEPSICVW